MRLSIVLPSYCEEENIGYIYDEILKACPDELASALELVFVDDGSRDNTFGKIRELARADSRIKGIQFSRNFGKSLALMAGLKEATGDVVITMDTDGQHPPALIPEFIKAHASGYDIVNTIRQYAGNTGWFKKKSSGLFYRLMNMLTESKMDSSAAEYRLMSRKALDAFLEIDERDRYTNGLVNWMGFRQTSLSFVAPDRHAGRTKFTLRKLIGHGLSGITSFSARPLRISMMVGMIILLLDLAYGVYAILNYFFGKTIPGWTSLMFTILFLGAIQLLSIGIIGEYIARIFTEAKKRPHYFIQDRC